MGYSEKELNANEKIILDLQPHWWFFYKQTLAIVGSLVLLIMVSVLDIHVVLTLIALALFAFSLGWLAVRYLIWAKTNFVVTTDRLINRFGVLNRQGIEIPLERVNTVLFSQSLFERMIGSGDLTIESAGEQGTQSFSDIRKPLNVQNEIHRQMENNENRKFDRINAQNSTSVASQKTVVQPAAPQLSIPDQIAKLDQLRQGGALSKEEFQTKKQELLDRM